MPGVQTTGVVFSLWLITFLKPGDVAVLLYFAYGRRKSAIADR
ncbi:hypothetical protein [Amycolatopsis sp. NPDC051071]